MSRIVWFSCGAASAVAAKIACERYGEEVMVVYCDTMSAEHPDNVRFFRDVETWIGRRIEKVRSDLYVSVDDVFEKRRYMSGPSGAICTSQMKKAPRIAYQRPGDIHIFGYTFDEQPRAEAFEDRNRDLLTEWLLIDQFITKADCLRRLKNAGIALPLMYSLGFEHNNCLGCVKSQSPGYWNRTRRLFPAVFERRAAQSRAIGARLVKIGGVRAFLDELPTDADAPDDDIECGPACQVPLFSEVT